MTISLVFNGSQFALKQEFKNGDFTIHTDERSYPLGHGYIGSQGYWEVDTKMVKMAIIATNDLGQLKNLLNYLVQLIVNNQWWVEMYHGYDQWLTHWLDDELDPLLLCCPEFDNKPVDEYNVVSWDEHRVLIVDEWKFSIVPREE